MKIVWGVTLHPQSLLTVKSLINFQIFYPCKIKIANTETMKICYKTKIWVQNVNLKSEIHMKQSKEIL